MDTRSRLSRREDFGHTRTKPTRRPRKVVVNEEEQEDAEEETKGSGEECEDSNSFIHATLEQMQINQTQHSDALASIQDTLQH